jgi:hypothetical protein
MINYRPVLPHGLVEESSEQDFSYVKQLSSDVTLKLGIVLKVLEIDDPDNRLEIAPEYNVMTIEDENVSVYQNCLCAESFGNAADFFTAKLRPTKDEVKTKKQATPQDQNGAIVLLLCLKGKSEQGVILKSLGHPNKKTPLTKEAGLHMEGEYNGVNWQVNKDGELTVTFKTPSTINDEGSVEYLDEEIGGTFVKIDKEGSVEISDSKAESIKINKTDQTISIEAEKDISHTTNANFNVVAKENIDLQATKDLLFSAEGKADVIIKKDMKAEISKNFKLKAKQVEVESESMIRIKARQAMLEASLLDMQVKQVTIKGNIVNVNASKIILGTGATPAVTLNTKFIGTGNLGGPVVSTAIGPFSPTVFVGS